MKSTIAMLCVQILFWNPVFCQKTGKASSDPDLKTTILYFEKYKPGNGFLFLDEFGEHNFIPIRDSIVIESINEKLYLEYDVQVIIIEAGSSVRLIEKDKFLVPVGYSREKELEFRFFENFRNEIESKDPPQGPWVFNRALLEEEYLKDLRHRDDTFNKKYQRNIAFLKAYQEKHQLSKSFYDTWSEYFKYKVMEGKTLLYTKYDRFPKEYVRSILALKDSLTDDRLLFMKQYQFTTHHLLALSMLDSLKTRTTTLTTNSECIQRLYSGKTRDFLWASLIRGYFSNEKILKNKEIKMVINDFNTISNNQTYKDYVNSFQRLNDVKNTDAFQVKNKGDQQEDLLKVFKKSKINYVDVWASWCGPCIAEMEASEKLRKEYEDKGVQFVFISIDENGFNWKKTNKRLGLGNSYIDASSAFAKAFKIKEIPRYFIFDENGKAISVSAQRPSDPEIRKTLDRLLKEKQ
jgi:thiol-disulfide isomerase/thioredoxin